MKPSDLKIKKIKVTTINDYSINTLEIDLKHINYGLTSDGEYRKKKRSNYTVENIAEFFVSLDGVELEYDMDEEYDYFVIEKNYFIQSKKFRMVFCIERSKPTISGIITLFQLKGGSDGLPRQKSNS